eukprot:COSAG05_NODE_2641_length_2811_cov_2.720133_3_plen_124_part_00
MAFLARLLQPDLSRRYTAAEALQDPWILVRAAVDEGKLTKPPCCAASKLPPTPLGTCELPMIAVAHLRWTLQMGPSPWTADQVAATIEGLDSSSVQVPSGFTMDDWVKQVQSYLTNYLYRPAV